jgi:5-hydroxyisourate hydrolase-like protein (transthyretin family)
MVALYRLTFEVGPYFRDNRVDGFYQEVTIAFVVKDASQHYHVPLLLSPFGYSTLSRELNDVSTIGPRTTTENREYA